MSDLAELLERVKAATGPDRELDAALLCATSPSYHLSKNSLGGTVICRDGFRWNIEDIAPYLITSIDAALALADRVLPGWWLHGLGKSPLHGLWWCTLYSLNAKEAAEVEDADTAPLAIIAATIYALIAQEPQPCAT